MFHYRAVTYFLFAGIFFTIISLPFLLGILQFTMALRNPYALIYGAFNFPVMYVLRDISSGIAGYFWEMPTPENIQTVDIAVSGCFWCAVGSVTGLYKDIREGW